MRTKKSTAFWASFWSLLAIYAGTLAISPDNIQHVGPAVVAAIALAGGLYQASNVVDHGVKGKYYRPELDKEKDA